MGTLSFCLLGELCLLSHCPRQPQRVCADRLVGIAVGVFVPNTSIGNRTVGTPPSDVFDVRYNRWPLAQ